MVDWPTVIFQIINFLVLVYLLKRFLYGRIIEAMDKREEKIASRLDDAEEKKKEAQAEAENYREKKREVEAQREQFLQKAQQEADQRRQELLKEAQQEVEQLEARWRQALQRQKEGFLDELRRRTAEHTFAIARRALQDLAGASLEERIAETFLQRLDSVDEEEWQALAQALGGGEEGPRQLTLRSSFQLPDDKQQAIGEAVQGHVGDGVELRFETSDDPLCGIELTGHGRKIAWSVGQYLDALQEAVSQIVEQQARQQPETREQVESDVREEERQAEERKKKQEEDEAAGEAEPQRGEPPETEAPEAEADTGHTQQPEQRASQDDEQPEPEANHG
ncbi:MAG: F0F1 ATP synthase subunit B [Candidatus Brocadiia bacterium]